MYVATDVADHIFFEQQTSTFHQNHIILHELGHMLCRHATPGPFRPAAGPGEGSPVASVRSALARTSYDTEQERDAEMVATLIFERAQQLPWPTLNAYDRRLGEALGAIDA
jgi:hypothetical protein